MSEKHDPYDPWAPPGDGASPERPADPPVTPPPGNAPGNRSPGVHDFPTMTSMPGAGGEVPPPPTAPGGPAPTSPYGYPDPTVPPGGGYGYPDPTVTSGGYGYPVPPPPAASGYPGYPGYGTWGAPAPSNGMGVAALVLGIIGVVLFCAWGLGVILGILALIFGLIGRRKARRGEADNGGMALAGVILGSVAIAIGAGFLAFLIWSVANDPEFSDPDPPRYDSALVVSDSGSPLGHH
ncbi:DUF4190 domain-containing protein [Streptomyces sp. NPDC046887]|uniref:DUF4190 domain-containing protein n=1 Tax=Streptomyces sp. NPDC046887 TaxID=3155472 RepID=UPI0033F3B22D